MAVFMKRRTLHVITGKRLSDYTEGDIVLLNENGSPVEFYVAKHDYESGLNGTGRTLLVRKDCYDSRPFNNSNANVYGQSSLDAWLNGDYKDMLDTAIQTAIGTTEFYYTPGDTVKTVTTFERAVFMLSVTEFGKSADYCNVEGSALPIASTLAIAYCSGSAVAQWTRSPYTKSSNGAWQLTTSGAVASVSHLNNKYSRPVFTLPSTIKFDENTNKFLRV